jgi:hypothetical protein
MFYEDSRKSDGLQSQCKDCFKDYRVKNSKQRKDYIESWRNKNSDHIKNYTKNYYDKNCERIKEAARKFHNENAEELKAKMRDRYWRNPKKNIERTGKWKKENPAKVNAKTAERRAMQLRATPSWADLAAIQIEYELAAWCSKTMGEPYHVDHIIPLQGKLVSGLHVHTNLRVIRASENIAKNNKFEVL